MKCLSLTSSLLISLAILSSVHAQRVDVDAMFELADVRLRARIAEASSYPNVRWLTRRDAASATWSATSNVSWDSGYFAGLLWQMERRTDDPQYRSWARKWTNGLIGLGPNDAIPNPFTGTVPPPDHDAGLIAMTAFAEAWESTHEPGFARVVHRATQQLQSRFVANKGVIRSWNWDAGAVPVIIDGMMSVQALGWSVEHGGGDAAAWNMQLTHSLTTAANHIRPDGSSYHLVNYTTMPPTRVTVQGYDDESTWSRGQGWAIYGFTESYRRSNNATLLTTARKAADFFLNNLEPDGMPLWDLELPSGGPTTLYQRDASAAAIAASGLIQLSRTTTNPAEQRRYFQAAEKMLNRLASSDYLAASVPGETRILLHSVGNFKTGVALDSSLVYSDYYFLEALDRYEQAFPGPGIEAGDANRDGSVNFDDLLVLAQHYGATANVDWMDGDFTGNGVVNFDDLLLLAQRYESNASVNASFATELSADWQLARSMVPEPLGVSGLAWLMIAAGRRSRRIG